MFIAPTEPPPLKAIGVSSLLPESHGVDIFWESALGKVGVQRKKFPSDFLASVYDGRLAREYPMMLVDLDIAVLLLEGRQYWGNNGNLIKDRGGRRVTWTRRAHRHHLASVMRMGIHVQVTDDLDDTIRFVEEFREWTDDPDHGSILRRPGPRGAGWGDLTNEDFLAHFIQGIPGMGQKTAKNLIDHFGGKLPLKLTVTEKELLAVPGVGKGMAKTIKEMFDADDIQ
jgi:ERCC4-type nuclease